MIRIELKNNQTGKDIYINDMFDYKAIPKDKLLVLITSLEKQLEEELKKDKENK